MKDHRKVDFDRWGGVAQVCRWGIVLLAMILVPGVAFLGQGLGRWLRARSESGWLPDAVLIDPGHPAAPDPDPEAPTAEFASHDHPPAIQDSAAMYDGQQGAAAFDATLAAYHAGRSESPPEEIVRTTGHAEPVGTPNESPFAEVEGILQDYGALHYALETDRHSGYVYRFHCIMPAAAGNGAQERFTATGHTPIEAVRNVLRQIEEWRAAQP